MLAVSEKNGYDCFILSIHLSDYTWGLVTAVMWCFVGLLFVVFDFIVILLNYVHALSLFIIHG